MKVIVVTFDLTVPPFGITLTFTFVEVKCLVLLQKHRFYCVSSVGSEAFVISDLKFVSA